jgi:hypothetical protein
MYRINQNQEIVSLLLKLKEVEEEYPADLLLAQRASFLTMITRFVGAWIRMNRMDRVDRMERVDRVLFK